MNLSEANYIDKTTQILEKRTNQHILSLIRNSRVDDLY